MSTRLNNITREKDYFVSVCYSDLPDNVLTMIETSMHLCESILRYTETLYPFAAVDLDGDLQPVFTHDAAKLNQGEDGSSRMIECLEQVIFNHTVHASNANSILIFAAVIETKNNQFTDVIVADVSLCEGATQQFYFPVMYQAGNVSIGAPLTNLLS